MKHLSFTDGRCLAVPIATASSHFAGRVADHDPSALRLETVGATNFAG